LAGRRVPEVVHADREAVLAEELVPRVRAARLDGDAAHARREELVAVRLGLLLEPLDARDGDDARLDPRGRELLRRLDGRTDLGAGRHDDEVGLAALSLGDG